MNSDDNDKEDEHIDGSAPRATTPYVASAFALVSDHRATLFK